MNFASTYTVRILLSSVVCMLLYIFFYLPLFSSNDDIGSICQGRCSGFTGQAYYRCIETCVRTMKKHVPPGERRVSERMKECEEICSVYKGVENVKCLRLCMERNKKEH